MSNNHSLQALLVVGGRPNLIKAAPVVAALRADGRLQPRVAHVGVTDAAAVPDTLFDELELRKPDISFDAMQETDAGQVATLMQMLEHQVLEHRPEIVITVGGVNATLAAALVASKSRIRLAHVEAGLRSGDSALPEEVNRVVTDHLADVLFTHSDEAEANLRGEGVTSERIHPVGSVMIDTLLRLRPRWQGLAAAAVGALPSEYGVVTLHQGANISDLNVLGGVMNALRTVAERLPLIFSVDPRTHSQLTFLRTDGLRLVEPLAYLPFMDLLEHARLVLTDSGGIQEETTVFGVPCLTMRDSTERPVTLRLGTNRLVGSRPGAIIAGVTDALAVPPPSPRRPPLWDGQAAARIAAILGDYLSGSDPLRLTA